MFKRLNRSDIIGLIGLVLGSWVLVTSLFMGLLGWAVGKGFVHEMRDQRSDTYHIVDSVLQAEAPKYLKGGVEDIVRQDLAKIIVKDLLDSVSGMDQQEFKETLELDMELAKQIRQGMDQEGITVEDMISNHKKAKQVKSLGIPLGPFLAPDGTFKFRWPDLYESAVYYSKPYDGLKKPVPTHERNGKEYWIPSMINNL